MEGKEQGAPSVPASPGSSSLAWRERNAGDDIMASLWPWARAVLNIGLGPAVEGKVLGAPSVPASLGSSSFRDDITASLGPVCVWRYLHLAWALEEWWDGIGWGGIEGALLGRAFLFCELCFAWQGRSEKARAMMYPQCERNNNKLWLLPRACHL